MNRIDLEGRRAVITGGAQGIGRAIAERFLACGASISLWDRDAALVDSAAAGLEARGIYWSDGVFKTIKSWGRSTASRWSAPRPS